MYGDQSLLWLRVSVCPRLKRKTARAISTLNFVDVQCMAVSRSVCIDPEVKRLKVKVSQLSNTLSAWVDVSIGTIRFLADRTIGRAFGTLCRLSVCRRLSVFNVLYCGKIVRLSEKLSEGVNRKRGSKSLFFGLPPYFYFRFRRYIHREGRFCLIFARTAQQSVLDGTNWFFSNKPCASCRLV